MHPLEAARFAVSYAVKAFIVLVALLMVIRLVMNYADVNPFGRIAFNLRRVTEPMISPVKRVLAGYGIDTKVAPLITILIAVLLGWFAVQLTDSVFFTIGSALEHSRAGDFVRAFGHLLYGLLDIYGILLFIRIVFSWGNVSYANPVMRFLMKITDPLLLPLRRMIPPLGMFDISPLVAFILIFLFKAAIRGTLL